MSYEERREAASILADKIVEVINDHVETKKPIDQLTSVLQVGIGIVGEVSGYDMDSEEFRSNGPKVMDAIKPLSESIDPQEMIILLLAAAQTIVMEITYNKEDWSEARAAAELILNKVIH